MQRLSFVKVTCFIKITISLQINEAFNLVNKKKRAYKGAFKLQAVSFI
jgi:hypothetical protein